MILSRRAAVAGLSTVAAAGLTAATVASGSAIALSTPGVVTLPAVDPAFAAIAEHIAATAGYLKGCEEHTGCDDYSPEWEATKPAFDAAVDRYYASLRRLFEAEATSLAGVAALLDHLSRPHWLTPWTKREIEDNLFETVWSDPLNSSDINEKLAALDFPKQLAASVRRIAASNNV